MAQTRLHPDTRFPHRDRKKLLRLEQIISRLEHRLAAARMARPDMNPRGMEDYLLGEIAAMQWAMEVLLHPDHSLPLAHIIRDVRACRVQRAKEEEMRCRTSSLPCLSSPDF
jgi:hypothetical protein